MANGIQKREKIIRTFLKNNKPDFTGTDSFADEIMYTKGIYPLFGDNLSSCPKPVQMMKGQISLQERKKVITKVILNHFISRPPTS